MNKAPWIDFRPEIKILDCSIRDGGLINDHIFDDVLVKAVYETCVASGIDYMEIGYKNDSGIFAPGRYGAWKHCQEDDIRRIVGDNDTPLKLTAMADAEKSNYKRDILPKQQSVLHMIRVATYINQIPTALDMVKDAKDKGYEVSINLMSISTVKENELEEALHLFAKSEADTVVIVDSFGTLYSEQVRDLTRQYVKAMKGTGKQVGIHAHNNQQLAFANTIEAIVAGANRLDATIFGIGRGAGNCALELLLGFLRNPKFNIRPVYQCIQDHFLKLREQIEWGPLIPYTISAQFNQHPRAAMQLRASENKDDYVGFYDRMLAD